MRLLIINADDFGYCSGINNGIIDSFKNGVLTSTTLMANMPGFSQAVDFAKANPELGVGVHLVLTCGAPLLENGFSITDEDGNFKNLSFYEKDFIIDQNEVYSEWKAQIEKIIDAGIEPDHLDSHHHVNTLPVISEVYEALAREFNLPVRGNYMVSEDLKTTNRFDDVIDHLGLMKEIWKPMDLHNFIEDVKNFGSVEAMCHPGYVDAELDSRSSFTTGRAYTAKELQKESFKKLLEREHISLGTYSDLMVTTG